ncbi:endoribonuclease L-PSP, putative [Halobacteroides halobius DSM 5150]|uniref:Endoribonuclease L-PSP, putative n=1 Tax=Halobacteroides halobius (strain ATCC 35273 / DSM 5150 / MD-1) TaxID=748449 RepID=L0KBJ0_HALHC|nr:RidA family protein [Halobacteroides halobius]AGB42361.1 endoribonuclease L-PSP, putative [Halobacteroides halobius DSM 5150]
MADLETVSTTEAPAAIGPYSQGVKCGNLLFVSGQIPLDPDPKRDDDLIKGGIEVQTKQVLENIKAILREADLELTDVVKTTLFISNMEDFEQINGVYSEYFTHHKPARACVEVARLPKGVGIEIEIIASID